MLARNGAGLASAVTDGEARVDLGAGKPCLHSRPSENSQDRAELHIGGQRTAVTVERDLVWSSMWRVQGGGHVSDIVSLARAKDAAIAWARPKGLGGNEVAIWHHRQSRGAASPMRQNGWRQT